MTLHCPRCGRAFRFHRTLRPTSGGAGPSRHVPCRPLAVRAGSHDDSHMATAGLNPHSGPDLYRVVSRSTAVATLPSGPSGLIPETATTSAPAMSPSVAGAL